MPRYGKKAQAKVKRAVHKMKAGTLKSGKSKKTVKSRKQAIAIGLSEARKEGAKVPTKAKKKAAASKKKKAAVKKRVTKRKTATAKKRAAA